MDQPDDAKQRVAGLMHTTGTFLDFQGVSRTGYSANRHMLLTDDNQQGNHAARPAHRPHSGRCHVHGRTRHHHRLRPHPQGRNEKEIRNGYLRFKKERLAAELAAVANPTASLPSACKTLWMACSSA
jgi:hypothetical protein